ncbi:NAD-dependent epimerase/dehydratase family protein [Fictibacillus iocasae]|uniref:NAD-dependent epimerase/dehydratase family protein n=1 Tax=Fictibacillus iocasae TaxID=2715437 RepID=A0ABW2NS83_9BACL
MNVRQAILITGAKGFTGMHACRHFHEKGLHVCGLYRSLPAVQVPWQTEIADLSDPIAIVQVIKKVKPSYVLHLAGVNSVRASWSDPLSCMNINVMGTLNLLHAIKEESRVSKIIVTGSMLEYNLAKGSAPHPYSLSKTMQTIAAESWFHFYHLHLMVVKPSNLIGPGPSEGVCTALARKVAMMEKGLSDNVLEVGSLNSARDFLDVRDAVRAYDVIFEQGTPGTSYELGSGHLRSIEDVVKQLKKLSAVSFSVMERTPLSADAASCHDLSKIEKLGWHSAFPFERSITDVLQAMRKEVAD